MRALARFPQALSRQRPCQPAAPPQEERSGETGPPCLGEVLLGAHGGLARLARLHARRRHRGRGGGLQGGAARQFVWGHASRRGKSCQQQGPRWQAQGRPLPAPSPPAAPPAPSRCSPLPAEGGEHQSRGARGDSTTASSPAQPGRSAGVPAACSSPYPQPASPRCRRRGRPPPLQCTRCRPRHRRPARRTCPARRWCPGRRRRRRRRRRPRGPLPRAPRGAACRHRLEAGGTGQVGGQDSRHQGLEPAPPAVAQSALRRTQAHLLRGLAGDHLLDLLHGWVWRLESGQ